MTCVSNMWLCQAIKRHGTQMTIRNNINTALVNMTTDADALFFCTKTAFHSNGMGN